ncbi:hypothetical protein B9Z19DRAFT_1123672 [Tuber borchii]|uniref:Uncharacterized protein n=1 Tax=Tuber borchii TaxID=42251 RepID=A0A2T6ZY56_TUBBO|nr:hypothetical protein B9Z19DRAFT_1123672 [Tuber borchii]
MSQAPSRRRETNPPPSAKDSSQASPLANGPSAGQNHTLSRDSTQSTPPVTETNTEPIRRASLDRSPRFLSLEVSWENTVASSSTQAAGLVCMPPPPVPVFSSTGSSPQGVRSGNPRDNFGEFPMVSTAANPVRPVSPLPLSYFVSQRLGDDLPIEVDREGFFQALASTIPPPPALAFYPLGSPSQCSAARDMGATHPLPINPATDAPPPAALPIDPEVTLAPPLVSEASEASYRPQKGPPLPHCQDNLVAVEKNPDSPSRHPVPRFRTMSDNLLVISAGDVSIISGASITGGYSTVIGRQNFRGPSLNGTENMGTDLTATPPVERTGQQGQQTRHTSVETSADDAHIADGSLFTSGKSIPSWMPRAVATEEAKRDAGTREEPTMPPTKRDRKTQHSREAEDEDKMDDDSFLASEERAVTPTPTRLTAIVDIIVHAVPRAVATVSKVLLLGAEPVPEKRRSHGRPRKIVVSDEAVASEQNTITDAGLYTDPVVALG